MADDGGGGGGGIGGAQSTSGSVARHAKQTDDGG